MLKSTAHSHRCEQCANECVLDTDIVEFCSFAVFTHVSASVVRVYVWAPISFPLTLTHRYVVYTNVVLHILLLYILLSLPILVFVFVSALLAGFQFRRRITTNQFDKTSDGIVIENVLFVLRLIWLFILILVVGAFRCMPLLFVMVVLLLSFCLLKHTDTHITQFIAYTLNGNLVVAKTSFFLLIW